MGEDDEEEFDAMPVCLNCHGTGGEPFDDGVTPCEHCDGEGYEWWH